MPGLRAASGVALPPLPPTSWKPNPDCSLVNSYVDFFASGIHSVVRLERCGVQPAPLHLHVPMPIGIYMRLLAISLALLASYTAMAIEEPSYRVLEQDGPYELREYAPHLVAETSVQADFERAGNAAFQRLFRYISGDNTTRQKIAMTAPVTQSRPTGEKIAMTAPVTQVASDEGYLVAFVVPAKYTPDTVPQPNDPTVRIRQIPAQQVAAWRYTGRWTTANYEQHEAELRRAMAARGLKATGEPVLARYNPPFMPSFMRRNEVLIPVTRPTYR
jgi:hypothetical protein